MTNYEWIKSMSIDEMSFIFDIVDGICDDYPHCVFNKACNECVKEWLMDERKDYDKQRHSESDEQ